MKHFFVGKLFGRSDTNAVRSVNSRKSKIFISKRVISLGCNDIYTLSNNKVTYREVSQLCGDGLQIKIQCLWIIFLGISHMSFTPCLWVKYIVDTTSNVGNKFHFVIPTAIPR